jgi:hypothetical protein
MLKAESSQSGSRKLSLSGGKDATESKTTSKGVKTLGETLIFFIINFKESLVAIIGAGKAFCFKDEWPRLDMTHWMSTEYAETIFLQKVKFT